MPISYKTSKTKKLLQYLFVNNKNIFKGSFLIKFLTKFDNEKISVIFLGLSLFCLWYKLLFAQIGFGWIDGYRLWAVFLLLSLLFCVKRRLYSSRAIIYLLLFLMSIILSSLWAAINGLELGMLLIGSLSLSLFPLAFIITSTYKNKINLINIILILSLPLLLVGCFQGLFGVETSKLWVLSTEDLVKTRAYGLLENPNALGALSMVTLIVSAFAFLAKRKWYYIVYLMFGIVALVLTFSRSAWLGLAVGAAVVVIMKNWRLIFFAPFGALALLVPSVRQRLLTAVSQQYLVDASLDGRLWAYNNSIDLFNTSPIFGVGPGSFGGQTAVYYDSSIYLRGAQNGYVAMYYSDTQWFQILAQCGIFGILSVGCFFVSYLVNNIREYLNSHANINLSFIAVAVSVLVSGFFENIWSFGVISVLAGAYLGLGSSNEK